MNYLNYYSIHRYVKKHFKLLSQCDKYGSKCRCSDFSRNLSISTPKPPWKIMFFGTDEFALQSLKMLHSEMNCNPEVVQDVRVVCAQLRCPVAKYSLKQNLPLLQWKPTVEEIVDTQSHIGLVVSFGHLIPSSIISAFPLGMLNVHASLLPRWRGAAPIIHAVLNRDKVTGVSIMKIKPHKFDEGEIVSSETCEIGPTQSAASLTEHLAVLGAQELCKCLQNLPLCLKQATPQPSTGATRAPKIIPCMSSCTWSTSTSDAVYAQYLALSHLYPLYATWQSQPIKILQCEVTEVTPGQPGQIKYDKQNKRLIVTCFDNTAISVKLLQMPGKPKITALDFYNGYLRKVTSNLWYFGPGIVT